MPELRCQRCRFWVPVESISRQAGELVCDRCRTVSADSQGEVEDEAGQETAAH